MADQAESVQFVQHVIEANPNDHLDLALLLNDLGNRLWDKFLRLGNLGDLERAIQVCRAAVAATTRDHPDRAALLNNLGVRLGDRFRRTGSMADLEEAIGKGCQAVDITPQNHPDYARRLSNLAIGLGNRFNRTGSTADLEEAIEKGRQAVDAVHQAHPDRAGLLSNLGSHLGYRYSRKGAIADLEEAVENGRQAIDYTPQNHPNRARYLNNLANHLGDRYSMTEPIGHFDEAIKRIRQAVDASPQHHPDRAVLLNNLASHLGYRYSRTGSIADLEEAIERGRHAVDTTPQDHPDQARWLNNLAGHLDKRYNRTGAMGDLEFSYCHSARALTQVTTSITNRIIAGRQLLSSEWASKDIRNVIKYAEMVLELLPQLVPSSLQNADKQHMLLQAAGIASNAAAIALMMQQTSVKAITWLEAGRGILASGLQDIRSDVSALQQNHPDLAAAFEDLRAILDGSVDRERENSHVSPSSRVQTETDRRRWAHEELGKTIQKIRKQTGFDRFFLPPAEAEIPMAAANGPIVFINVSRHRCDALLVLPTGVQCIELSDNLYCDIQEFRKTVVSPSSTMLKWLWDCVVNPVLTQLGMLNSPPAGEQWPRVWWIPTGPLVGFPLHAAGYHLEKRGQTTLDRVVSSYATSLRSLKASIKNPQQPSQDIAAGSKVALIAMKATPKQSPLHFASRETEEVQAICESIGLQPVLPDPCKKEVLSALETSSIFHFAGHSGMGSSPLNSFLLLKDWEEGPLTVDSLLQMNLSSSSLFLAYLSACGTGQVREQEMLDENIHLAAAYQLAGFRHVIGTLWNVDDSMCVDMAKMIYEDLRDEGINDRSVREGLHRASRRLRDAWVTNEKAKSEGFGGTRLVRDGYLDDTIERGELAYWIPYVHYGA